MGAKVARFERVHTYPDEKTGEIKEDKSVSTWSVTKTGEPDFVKLYPEAWMPKKKTLAEGESPAGKKTATARGKSATDEEDTAHLTLPAAYRFLFFILAARMCYCDSDDLAHSQLVHTGEPYRDEIMEIMGWTNRDSLMKGLRTLCECNAIRKVSRGCYQINPRFASKGQWLYNPRIPQSNVEGLKKYYDDERRKARMKKEGKEKGLPAADTADNPPAVEETVTPPEIPDNAEPDDDYDDGGFNDVHGRFHK